MNKLWVRLSLAFSGVVLVAVLILVATTILLERFDDNDRFNDRFLGEPGGLVAQLGRYYQTEQSWAGVEPLLVGAQAVFYKPNLTFLLADADQDIVYDPRPELVDTPLDGVETVAVMPIEVAGQTVGFLGVALNPDRLEQEARPALFIYRPLINGLLFIAAVGGVGGIIFGVVMSRGLTAPLNDLARAAKAFGSRNLSQRVAEKGSDELIAVARAFNEMAADLEQGEQLRRNLLADVAHELRTPLSVLQGNLRAILDEVYPLNLEEMARLYEHTRFLSRLVNDLHELAQAEAHQLHLNLQATDLTQLVKNTTDTFRPSAEAKGVRLKTELAERVPPVQVDAARITQVMQNLLANALRHTGEAGQITVKIEPNAANVQLTIADSGEGIPPEHLPHIFDRFYRADPARSRDRGGAGLGLAIARAIVEAHGGQISVSSSGVAGQGSEFRLKLPITNEGQPRSYPVG